MARAMSRDATVELCLQEMRREFGLIGSLAEDSEFLGHQSRQLVPVGRQVVQNLGDLRLHAFECFVPLPQGMLPQELPKAFDQVQVR